MGGLGVKGAGSKGGSRGVPGNVQNWVQHIDGCL